ncbi:MAG: GNAT family N-acetyltransferase [Gammaproteobacteria bacterium]|nr:GNAT family N-acetyltransferase [Gammaproteobacteria bacterium]
MRAAGWCIEAFDPTSETARAQWNGLVARTHGSVVQRAEFIFSCAATLAKPRLRLALFWQDDEVAACALLQARWGVPDIFIESVLPLGAWVQQPALSLAALADSLLKRLPFGLRLGMSQIDPRYAPQPAPSAHASTLPYIQTPWLEVAGNYPDYWAARGKNLRTNLRKQRAKLAAAGIPTRLEILRAPADMARAIQDYAALESLGWKAAGGTAVSADHPQTRFYRQMLEAYASQGQARIYRYFFGEQLVATELCLCADGEFVILKTTYDERTAPLSPASLLRQEMFEGLFGEGGIERVEFYGPLKEWHTRWTPHSRDIYHANIYAPTLMGALLQKFLVGRRPPRVLTS